MYGGVAYGYSKGVVTSQRNSLNAQWPKTGHCRCGHGNYRAQNQE